MKIGFYNVTAGVHFGGLETYCWEVAHQLAARGHCVSVIAGLGGSPRRPGIEFIQIPFKRREFFPNFGTRFRKLMERLSFARGALPHLLEGRYDAIIINKPMDFPVLWIARRRGMKTATLFRSGGTDFFPGDRLFTPAVDVWISASQYNARQVEERYGRSVRVIYNGVDTNLFRPRDRDPQIRNSWGVPAGAPLIMSCGRLVGWKGLHIVIEAIGPLLDVHFVIVGEGPERARLERMVMALQLQERVHFRGIIAHDQLPEALSQSDIFVQPSLGEEAFGISVVEAMAVGIPVLASCNGGLKEIVVPERTGLLLPPGEVKAWREAIDEMIRRPDVRHSMGREARGRVESEFTWSNNARILETLLQRKRCAES